MRRLLPFSVAALLAFMITPALAAPTVDDFSIDLIGPNQFVAGSGSGFGGGMLGTPWFYYQDTQWYNQWFYDAPADPTRWKEISWDINMATVLGARVKIALNWSTLAYSESGFDGFPPLPQLLSTPDLEPLWIARYVIFDGFIAGLPVHIDGTYIIPDYNPEWVSIDIYAEATAFPVNVSGTITHECIPAPSAIFLGSFGVGLVGWLRRRRTL